MTKSQGSSPSISDDAVRNATGRGWGDWFQLLDSAGAAGCAHREIVALVRGISGPGAWWEQMIAVSYEQRRGMRDKHQKSDGYQISASRTIDVPIASAWEAWSLSRKRIRWLGENLSISGRSELRSLRFPWKTGGKCLVTFVEKGEGRCTVSVEHSRIDTAEHAEETKLFWREALGRMKSMLETN
jgi:uncharacterized protein YndB with AHSA1/START domain